MKWQRLIALGGWISCLWLLHAVAIPSMRLMWNRRQSFWSCVTQTVLVSAAVVPTRPQKWQVFVAVQGLGDTRKHKHQNKGNIAYIQYALNTHLPTYLKLLLLNSWHERIGCCMYAEFSGERIALEAQAKQWETQLEMIGTEFANSSP